MIQHKSQLDYYGVLQVSPQASRDEIATAYQRLQELYSAERMADAAPEFQAQAAAKREQLAVAFETLSDAQRRAAYDREHGQVDGTRRPSPAQISANTLPAIDYRPLPPARGKERERQVEAIAPRSQERSTARSGLRGWLPVIAVTLALPAVLLVIVLTPVRATSDPVAIATPALPNIALPFSDVQIRQFRAAAESINSFENWVSLGNALFDNLSTMRENAPQSPQYRNSLGDWLQAAQAYERALALRDDPVVRSDRAVALFNYGLDAQDEQRVAEAVVEVERGIQLNETAPRALLNYGLVLTSINPPRTDEAVAQWQKIVDATPQPPEAERARILIEMYGRQ